MPQNTAVNEKVSIQDMENNALRTRKIMTAMGLNPDDATASGIFRYMTGIGESQLARGLGEWQNANALKVMLGRMAGQKFLSQQNVDKYLSKARERRQHLEGLVSRGQVMDSQWWVQPEIEQLRAVENKLGDPKALLQLVGWFQRIKRPGDIDKIPIESVTSEITY